MLSLGIIDKEHATPGTEVNVIWGSKGSNQKIIRAVSNPYTSNLELSILTVPGCASGAVQGGQAAALVCEEQATPKLI